MTVLRWEEDCLCSYFKPSHIVLARLFDGDDLKALVEFRGTLQRHFYIVRLFQREPSVEVACFRFLDDAKRHVHDSLLQ